MRNLIGLVITKLQKSVFFKNVFIVMSGTVAAQVIGFALSPVISRLFTPTDFGTFGSFDAVLTMITAGITLEYYQAIMLPREKKDAFHLFILSCLCMLMITFLCMITCLIIPGTINGLMKTNGFWALALLIVAILITGLNTASQAWCIRAKAFKHTAASQVIRSLSGNSMQIGAGILKSKSTGLIISSVAANVLASLNLIRVLLPDLKALRPFIRWRRMKELAYEYRDFPIWSASISYINAISVGLPILLITHFYGIAVAGAYAFGLRIIQAPMSFIVSALRQVLFQKACETQHDGGRLLPLYMKTTLGLLAISVLPCFVILMWAPQLFSFVFGSKWLMAGELARSLVLWLISVFVGVPSVLFARAMRMQRRLFYLDIILLIVRTSALILGGLYLSPIRTIFAFSLIGATFNVAFILLVARALLKKDKAGSWSIESASGD